MIEIDFAELAQLYLIALSVAVPLIAVRVWRRQPILRLNLLRNGG